MNFLTTITQFKFMLMIFQVKAGGLFCLKPMTQLSLYRSKVKFFLDNKSLLRCSELNFTGLGWNVHFYCYSSYSIISLRRKTLCGYVKDVSLHNYRSS